MGVPLFKQLWGTEEQIDLHGFHDLSSSIDKISFKSNSMSLGLVLEKLFTWTPQSDAIVSSDKSAIQNINLKITLVYMGV